MTKIAYLIYIIVHTQWVSSLAVGEWISSGKMRWGKSVMCPEICVHLTIITYIMPHAAFVAAFTTAAVVDDNTIVGFFLVLSFSQHHHHHQLHVKIIYAARWRIYDQHTIYVRCVTMRIIRHFFGITNCRKNRMKRLCLMLNRNDDTIRCKRAREKTAKIAQKKHTSS